MILESGTVSQLCTQRGPAKFALDMSDQHCPRSSSRRQAAISSMTVTGQIVPIHTSSAEHNRQSVDVFSHHTWWFLHVCPCCCLYRCCGDEYHMDLSKWAFEKIASTGAGAVGIYYRQVSCPGGETLEYLATCISGQTLSDLSEFYKNKSLGVYGCPFLS